MVLYNTVMDRSLFGESGGFKGLLSVFTDSVCQFLFRTMGCKTLKHNSLEIFLFVRKLCP